MKRPGYLVAAVALSTVAMLAESSRGAEDPRITEGSNVVFRYEITVPDANVKLADVGQFVQGEHQILPAVERQMTGMKAGDEKKVELSVEEGFGPYDARKKKLVPKTDLPQGVKQGDVLEDRAGTPAMITEMSENAAVLDYNHPLAGKPIIMQITILKVDNPS